ncbi:MAG: NAD-dependent epimerase/dehydratase family protein [Patescibacteria group bacterium]|nr:NAD-dependent epimerase/dehydratase family protein [Patescibacteria group bacterium]
MKKDDLVLITGGAGFIGSHTVDKFINNGYKVRIMDNLSAHEGRWPSYINKKAQKVIGDVTNIKDWEMSLENVSVVIHLAGIMDFHLEFSRFFQINTVGTANLYEAVVKNKLNIEKVVIASSQFVYGFGKWKCQRHGVLYPKEVPERLKKENRWDPICPMCGQSLTYLKNSEEQQADPPNQYAISKYSQELIGLKLGRLYNIPTSVLRYSIAHGSRQNVKNLYSGALRIFALQIMNNQPISLYEDGNNLRDFVSVKDVANANLVTATNPKSNYQIYNVGGGKSYTIAKLAKMIAKSLNKDLKISTGSYRLGDIRHSVSDISKIQKLGWKPTRAESQNINEFLRWLKKQNISSTHLDKIMNEMREKNTIRSFAK